MPTDFTVSYNFLLLLLFFPLPTTPTNKKGKKTKEQSMARPKYWTLLFHASFHIEIASARTRIHVFSYLIGLVITVSLIQMAIWPDKNIPAQGFSCHSASLQVGVQPHTPTASPRHFGDDCCKYVFIHSIMSLFSMLFSASFPAKLSIYLSSTIWLPKAICFICEDGSFSSSCVTNSICNSPSPKKHHQGQPALRTSTYMQTHNHIKSIKRKKSKGEKR